ILRDGPATVRQLLALRSSGRSHPLSRGVMRGAHAVTDTSVTKVKSSFSPRGTMGQKYLASGVHVAMRLWTEEAPGAPKPATRREYETVGYVLAGRAELLIEGQTLVLEPGDS